MSVFGRLSGREPVTLQNINFDIVVYIMLYNSQFIISGGVYKKTSTDDQLLVGHIPIELSRIMAGFLAASITNSLIVKPCGKRRREIGLIIPGSYYARSNQKSL